MSKGQEQGGSLQEQLTALAKARHWGQRQLGDMLGVSQTVVSQWLHGTYPAMDSMDRRVAEFLQARAEVGEGIVPAQGYQIIQEICGQCQEDRKFGVVQGDPGVGKTRSLLVYSQEHDDCIYVRVDVTTTLKVLLEELAASFGGGLTNAQLMREAKAHCQGKLLIVDEADLLAIRSLEALRAIWGDGGHCGLVLAGTPRLERLLRRGPHARENLAQLYSRVDFNVVITNPKPDDLAQYLDASGVTDQEARRLITAEGQRGSFRAAAKLLAQAQRVARLNEQPTVTGSAVRAARQIIMPAHV